MDFQKMICPAKKEAVYCEKDYYVWCGSLVKYRGKYFLFYSRWKKELGFGGWVTSSEICMASSWDMYGKFEFERVLFTDEHNDRWDSSCKHNPTVIEYNGRFYLYYMGNRGNGEYWVHRNNQRIGCAWCDEPLGDWHRSEKPVIDVSKDGFDSLLVSNPAVTVMPDNRILMVYKGVEKTGNIPQGGAVLCGAAIAEIPLGEFKKCGGAIMKNPQNEQSVEDPFIWYQNDRYYALVKDFNGYFTKTEKVSTALFESFDAKDWRTSEYPLAFTTQIKWSDGTTEQVHHLERPQIYFENGLPKTLLCACCRNSRREDSFNIRFELKQ